MVSGVGGAAAVSGERAAVVLSVWWRGWGFGWWWGRGFEEFEGDGGGEGAGPIAGDAVGFTVIEVPFP